MAGVKSKVQTFRTAPLKSGKLNFIVYGDSRDNPKVHEALGKKFGAHQPAFILHCGDFVHRAVQYDKWNRDFFQPLVHSLGSGVLLSVGAATCK